MWYFCVKIGIIPPTDFEGVWNDFFFLVLFWKLFRSSWKVNFVKNAGSTKLCWIYWSRYQDLKWTVQHSTWRSFSILVFMMF